MFEDRDRVLHYSSSLSQIGGNSPASLSSEAATISFKE